MIATIIIANSKPWCPYCERGYQLQRKITLDATPQVEAHIIFEYACTDCGKVMVFTEEDIEETATKTIGIESLQTIASRRKE